MEQKLKDYQQSNHSSEYNQVVRELQFVEKQIEEAESSGAASNQINELRKKKALLLEKIGSSVYSTQTVNQLKSQLNALQNQLRAAEERRNTRMSECDQKKRLNDQTLVSAVNNLGACNQRLALYEQQVKEVRLMAAYHIAVAFTDQDLRLHTGEPATGGSARSQRQLLSLSGTRKRKGNGSVGTGTHCGRLQTVDPQYIR